MAREASAGGNTLARLKPEMQHYARYWNAILVADRTGRVVLASQPDLVGQNLSGRDYFERGLKGQPFVSGVWEVDGKPSIALATPVAIESRSRVPAVLIAYISAAPLRELLHKFVANVGPKSFAVLVDDNLLCVAHTSNPSHELRPLAPLPDKVWRQFVAQRRLGNQTEAILQTSVHRPQCGPKVENAIRSIDKWPFRRMDPHAQNPVHILGMRLRQHPWTVLVCVPDAAIASQIAVHQRVNTTTAILVILAAGLVGLLFSQHIVRPIEDLTEAAERMGQGDLSARTGVKGKGEVGVLARSFNAMAHNFQQRSREMAEANIALKKEISERKQADEALAQLSRQMELVLNSAGEGIFGLDVRGNHTFVNLAGATMLGYAPEELLGLHSHSTWHHTKPDGTPYPSEECPIYAALRDGEVHHVADEVFWRKDGSCFPVEYTSTPIRESGEVVGAVVVFTDITERRRAEELRRGESAVNAALLELETALGKAQGKQTVCEVAVGLVAHIIADARGFVWLWDEERNRLRPAAFPAGLPEDLRATFFSPDISYEREQDFAEVLRTHEVFVVADVDKDPRVNQEAVRGFGIRSFILAPLMAGDQILGVMSVERGEAGAFSEREIELTRAAAQRIGMALSGEGAREVVQQQLARVSLLNQIARAIAERQDVASVLRVVLQTLEQEMPVDHGIVLFSNPDSDGFTVAAIGAKNYSILEELGLTEGTGIPMDDALQACVRNETVYAPDNAEIKAPAPQKLAKAGIRSSVLVPLNVEGELKGILIAIRRETDGFTSSDCEFLRQLAEHVALVIHHAGLYQDLQKAYDELQSAQQAMMQQERLQALGQLASGIAHDINNALSPVLGFSELLLLRGGWDTETQNSLQAISTSASDIAAIVARLREFYRKRPQQEQLMPVDVHQLVKTAVALTHPRWHDIPMEQGVVIDVNNRVPRALPSLLGNEAELREALTNLIINAVDAMPDGGTITLNAHSQALTHVVIEVSDTGVGMTEEVRQHCLEPFYSTKGQRGTGMGLSMVYGIIGRHEGEMDIRSAPGKGTTFILRLPITRETRAEPVPQLSVVKPQRVLCVDDDPRLRQLLTATLTQLGHQVEVADGGQAGIEAFDAGRFDVVITDLGMPEVDGRVVAKAIKDQSPATPVILLTGWGTRLQTEEDMPEGVDLVLGKPVTPDQLQAALAKVTSKS